MKWIALSFLFCIYFYASAFAAKDRIQIIAVTGPVKVLHLGQTHESRQKQGSWLNAGDEIETVSGQVATLNDGQGSQWQLGGDSKLRLESSSREGGGPRLMGLLKGTLWGENRGGPDKEFRLKVRTNSGALGVKRAEFLLQEKEGLSSVDVRTGEAYFGNSLDFAEGSFVRVKAGERSAFERVGTKGQMRAQAPVKASLSAAEIMRSYGFSEALPNAK